MGNFSVNDTLVSQSQQMLSGLQGIGDQWQHVASLFRSMEGEWQGLASDSAGMTFSQMDRDMKTYLVELENFCNNVIKFHGNTTEVDQLGSRMLTLQ